MKTLKKMIGMMMAVFFLATCLMVPAVLSQDDNSTEGYLRTGAGVEGGTYFKMTTDAKKYYPAMIIDKNSTGGFDNTLGLLNKDFEMAIIQPDVLKFMAKADPRVNDLRSLMSWHRNFIHLIVLRNGIKISTGYFSSETKMIKDLRDLRDGPIACFGSAPITMRLINEKTGLNMKIIQVNSPQEGFQMLDRGEVNCFVAMGGVPIGWLNKLKGQEADRYTLATIEPSEMAKISDTYQPAQITYRNLGAVGFYTAAISNDVVVYNYSGEVAQKLLAFKAAIIQNLNKLKNDPKTHVSWRDVKNPEKVSWTKYEPSDTGSGYEASSPVGEQEVKKAEEPVQQENSVKKQRPRKKH